MDLQEAKYTRVEYERRFLVSPQADWRSAVEPYSKVFEDKYLAGTRLRLRIQTDTDSGRQLIKLNKKFESPSPYFQTISRILLSPSEYALLAGAEGHGLKKVRYYHNYLDRVFSIDVVEGELDGLVLCEAEAESLEELMLVKFPAYAHREVTEDPFFTGGNLCRTTRAELLRKLSTFGGDFPPRRGRLPPRRGRLSPTAGELSPMTGELSPTTGEPSPGAKFPSEGENGLYRGRVVPLRGGRITSTRGTRPY